jgi:hypothetical protein
MFLQCVDNGYILNHTVEVCASASRVHAYGDELNGGVKTKCKGYAL